MDPLYGSWIYTAAVGPVEDPGPGKFTLADWFPNGLTITVHGIDATGRDCGPALAALGTSDSGLSHIQIQEAANPAQYARQIPGGYAGGLIGSTYIAVWLNLLLDFGTGISQAEGDEYLLAFEPVSAVEPIPVTSYATAAELARILLIPNPTPAQTEAMDRVLQAAATEITEYLGLDAPLVEPYPALVVEVNLERAVEHWKQEQSPFGIVVLGGELPPGHAGVNAWRRHARTLLPLKKSWGIA
jgi:hypothetical protein